MTATASRLAGLALTSILEPAHISVWTAGGGS